MSIQWCEKGLIANKFISVCIAGDVEMSKKLIDGIGTTVADNYERTIIESSGEEDGDHTTEDTHKIMECGSQCLKLEMANCSLASFETFKKRRVLEVQYIGNKLSLLSIGLMNKEKWGCVLVRSAVVPRTWRQRCHWMSVFELLKKMDEIVEEQDALTELLEREHTGCIAVLPEDTIKTVLNSN